MENQLSMFDNNGVIITHKENNPESQRFFEENEPKFNKQCKIVYEALKRGERLSTKKALIDYGIGDLRRRVKDLIDIFGLQIQKERMPGGYKEYYL